MRNENLILVDQFCLHHSIDMTFIAGLHDYGMIEIIVLDEKQYFSEEQLALVEKMVRLHYELEINLEGIDTIMTLLQQIENLQNELINSRNKINFLKNIIKMNLTQTK